MNRLWFSAIALGCCLQLACSGENNKTDSLPVEHKDSGVSLVFPVNNSFTDHSSVVVKGVMESGVTQLKVNGVAVNADTYPGFWVANIPLNVGQNALQFSFTRDDGTQYPSRVTEKDQQLEGYSITRGNLPIESLNGTAGYDAARDRSLFIDGSGKSLVAIDHQSGAFTYLLNEFSFSEQGLKIQYDSNLVIDNDQLYLVLEGNDQSRVISYNLADGQISTIWDAKDDQQNSIDLEYIALFKEQGLAGSLVVGGTNDHPWIIDLASNEASSLPIAKVNSYTSNTPRVSGLFRSGENKLLLIGRQQRNSQLFVAEFDLTDCDEKTDCTISYTRLKTEFTLADGCGNPGRVSEHSYHAPSNSIVYEYQSFCSINLNTDHADLFLDQAVENISRIGDNYTVRDIALTDQYAWMLDDNNRVFKADVSADYINQQPKAEVVVSRFTVGESLIDLKVPRELTLDTANQQLFVMDRDPGRIYKMGLRDGGRSLLLERALNFNPEEVVYDPVDNRLYVIDDGGNALYSVNADSGELTLLLDSEKDSAKGINRPEAVALDVQNRKLFIAHELKYEDVLEGYSQFNLLSLDLTNGTLEEISPSMSKSLALGDIEADYDMVFDRINNQVVFYESTTNNPIYTINVETGTRQLLTDKETYSDQISTSNSRGHAMDLANNRLLSTSQNEHVIYATSMQDGSRSVVSEYDNRLGPVFWQPKGIDYDETNHISYVGDENLDAIYQVDIDTGYRVIIQR